ncbi:alpha-L-fucosidase [Marinilabiliaceae bacterium ANBcel2]|nr:alpha-L-fucosidase [Marinilabiliaceae bacterium ANBcel2]
MRNKTFFLTIISLCLMALTVKGDEKERMQWFKDAKLGVFIHYGIYAVDGIDESWSFFNGYISHKDYMKQLDGFTASNYDTDRWARLFKEAGAQYIIMTSKHHDGVALWESDTDHLNVVDHTPANRDLVTPFMNSMRDHGMKAGLYYSLIDWSYPNYPAFTRDSVRYHNDPERWEEFRLFMFKQLEEIADKFDPAVYWFDGDWEHSADEWHSSKIREMILNNNSSAIINDRLNEYGDYSTPEQGMPVAQPANKYWELCLTTNDSWGYQHQDVNYKTPYQVIWTFADCISKGGNLLLNVGPKEDGTIPKPQKEILKEMGRWTNKHKEAIYGTRKGIPKENFNGLSSTSADNKTIYLYIDYTPNIPIKIKGLKSEVKDIRVVGKDNNIDFNYNRNSKELSFKFAKELADEKLTVIAVDLEEEAKLETPSQTLAEDLIDKLKEDDRWYKKHKHVLQNAKEGISPIHYAGTTLLSKDEEILYLVVEGDPHGPVVIKGLNNKINRIWVAGHGSQLPHEVMGDIYWSSFPGTAYIDIPKRVQDEKATVIALLLEGKISLYSEEGHAIESN